MITIKTKEEIEILRKGGRILAMILDELEKEVVVGNTTLDVDDRAMELIEEYKVEPMILGYNASFANRAYPAASCVSINDVVVHGIPNESPQTFMEGDVVSIDVVIGYEGLVVDSARTVGVGKLSPQAKQLIQVTKEALSAGIAAAKAGGYVRDIGAAIEKVVPKKFGIIESFCGHGVGYSLHEEPMVPNYVMNGPSPKLEPGMVLAIEPMITLGGIEVEILEDGYTAVTADGSLSAHMEHTVLIAKDGPEILTLS
ncbi:type I methionyl aminopeptidase [Candidatus Kaiserbacteria bacterium]|nr:type I methionyl aminopeptidase [Candidatus Kaiserbacteria bacterium]